jgi:hypothetical protein
VRRPAPFLRGVGWSACPYFPYYEKATCTAILVGCGIQKQTVAQVSWWLFRFPTSKTKKQGAAETEKADSLDKRKSQIALAS